MHIHKITAKIFSIVMSAVSVLSLFSVSASVIEQTVKKFSVYGKIPKSMMPGMLNLILKPTL